MLLKIIADALDSAERMGSQEDDPEGSRYIILSDTLAKEISETLRSYDDA